MFRLKEIIVLILALSVLIQSVSAISNVGHSVDGNKVTLTYQGTPPFWINIREDSNIGQNSGYLWAKTSSNSFTYDAGLASNPSKKFYYGVKDESWSSTYSFNLGAVVQKSKVYVVKDTYSLLRASSFIKEGSNIPLIIYVPGREVEIVNLIKAFKSEISVKLVYNDNSNFVALENEFNKNNILFDKSSIDSLTVGNYEFISFSDEEQLKPYAAVFAGKNDGLFLDSFSDISKYIYKIPSKKIVYFGSNANTLTQIRTYSTNVEQITTLQNSEIKLAPTNSNDKIVTIIPKIPSEYSRLGVLYAIYRDTALISVTGQEDDAFSFDYGINEQLNLIKPYNGNQEYKYMVIVGNWTEIPYNYVMPSNIVDFNGGNFPYRYSSDMMYADRNSFWSTNDIGDEDRYFIPDMGVGRILGYDLASASIILNIGYLYENDLLIKSNKAIYSSDWAIDGSFSNSLYIVNHLKNMYGTENVYAIGDPTSTNYINNAPRDQILNLSKDREFILLQGHGAPNYLSATSPEIEGKAILEKRSYKPAFWYLSACTTIGYCDYCNYNNLDGALRSLATNVYGTVDLAGTGSGWEQWYMPYFADNYRIGDVIRLGLQDSSHYFTDCDLNIAGCNEATVNPNTPSQFQVIGDPLVSYGTLKKMAPTMAIQASATFGETATNRKVIYLSSDMLNFVTAPFESYTLEFKGDCGKMIIIDNKEGLSKISGISSINYNEIKNLVSSVSGVKTDINQKSISSFDKDTLIVTQNSCELIFQKK